MDSYYYLRVEDVDKVVFYKFDNESFRDDFQEKLREHSSLKITPLDINPEFVVVRAALIVDNEPPHPILEKEWELVQDEEGSKVWMINYPKML